jgi:hypothetical protein
MQAIAGVLIVAIIFRLKNWVWRNKQKNDDDDGQMEVKSEGG